MEKLKCNRESLVIDVVLRNDTFSWKREMLVKQKMKMSQHSEQHLVPKCQGHFCCGSMEMLIKIR